MHAPSSFFPESLRELPPRSGERPRVDTRYPSLQLEQIAPDHLRDLLVEIGASLEGVSVRPTEMSVPGEALVLEEELAKGKPEGFVYRREFAIVRDDGSMQVNLDPDCGQYVLDKGWATVHPLARYMAGALPPQSLIVYAPRDPDELAVAGTILDVAYRYAVGRFGDLILPDSAW